MKMRGGGGRRSQTHSNSTLVKCRNVQLPKVVWQEIRKYEYGPPNDEE